MSSRDEPTRTDMVPQTVRPRTFRIDDETWEIAENYASVQGVSPAEYVRRAVISQIAHDRETIAFTEGADPEQARQALLARMLRRAATDVELVARSMGEPPRTSAD
jgi:hypothetical protein